MSVFLYLVELLRWVGAVVESRVPHWLIGYVQSDSNEIHLANPCIHTWSSPFHQETKSKFPFFKQETNGTSGIDPSPHS